MFNFVLFIFGIVCIFYDIILICINPGTFLDNLTSFTHIWSVLGGYLIFLGIYRKQTGHSFISTWKKWVKKVVASIFGVAGIICIINLLFILNPKEYKQNETKKVVREYVILLGGGIDKNGRLPKSVQNRVEAASNFLKNNPDDICVVTGGTLKWLPYPEAPAIKSSLVDTGINSERILVEDRALDTIQNFEYSSQVLSEQLGVDVEEILKSRIVIVTSRFHLRRAERLATRMGFENVEGIAAHDISFAIVHNYVREICAYIKLNARILFTGKPEKIYSDKTL